ncbi:MAG: OmpA family protein [Bacteroidales bacterium]|nr:OmpA family protein [Bacteroidales bacterium]
MKRLDLILGAAALLAALIAAPVSVNAQEDGNRDEFGNIVRGPYETNSFGDNWFVGIGGGINVFLNEGFDAKIGPSLDVNFGKWFTPSVGMRIGYQGLNAQTWSDAATVLGPKLDKDKGKYAEKFGYMYIHGDFLWNISNALSGYKETRFWNFVPYLHAGFFRSYDVEGDDFSNNELAVGAGLLHNLRVTDRLDVIIDMRATVMNGQIHGSSGAAVLPSVTAGVAFDLGWPNFVRTATILGAVEAANLEKTAILETAIVALEAANASLEAENVNLKKKNSDLNKKVKTLEAEEKTVEAAYEDMSPITVYFAIGKTVLDDKELKHLEFYTKNIIEKVEKGSKVEINLMGSADSNTGTPKRNKYLSEARGKYIMDLLTKTYGISPDRISVKSEVVKAAAKPDLSRAVIISF